MLVKIQVDTANLTEAQGNLLLSLLTGGTPSTNSSTPSVASPSPTSSVAAAPATSPVQTTVAPQADTPAETKPKRKRRTKAQIAADEAAAAAAAATPATPEVVEVDPLGEVPVAIDVTNTAPTEDEVKAEVVAAVGRLTADGDASPTATVVAVLEKASGKKRVGEISPDQYHAVIAALLEVGTAF